MREAVGVGQARVSFHTEAARGGRGRGRREGGPAGVWSPAAGNAPGGTVVPGRGGTGPGLPAVRGEEMPGV